jgi:hypothetical protein
MHPYTDVLELTLGSMNISGGGRNAIITDGQVDGLTEGRTSM